MLGATIDVLTLDGMVELKVSQGIQHDTMLLMRGRGVRELQVSREGDSEGRREGGREGGRE